VSSCILALRAHVYAVTILKIYYKRCDRQGQVPQHKPHTHTHTHTHIHTRTLWFQKERHPPLRKKKYTKNQKRACRVGGSWYAHGLVCVRAILYAVGEFFPAAQAGVEDELGALIHGMSHKRVSGPTFFPMVCAICVFLHTLSVSTGIY
jgi:hypothetical protein